MFRTILIATTLLATPAVAQDAAKGDYADINGMRLYYEVSGSGDPLIVLHGAYMNIETMGGIVPGGR